MIFSKRKTIGVFISKLFRAFDEAFFKQLEIEAKKLDYDVVVFMTAGYYIAKNDYDKQEQNILNFVDFDKLDGIIAVPSSYEKGEFRDKLVESLRNCKCPVVILRENSTEFNCVYTDNIEATRKIMKHLIEDHGLKKICFQGVLSGNLEVNDRHRAYAEEMEKHGLHYGDDTCCDGNMWTNTGDIAYDKFFSDPTNLPEAVVCANDYMAMGLIRVLREHDISVPNDVIVTGFDNISDWCIDVPSITSIKPDYEGMTSQGFNLLDKLIKKIALKQPVKMPLSGIFVKGESCGCGKKPENYFKQVATKTTSLLEIENDQDASMNNLGIDLGGCDNLTDLHEVLISERANIPIIRDHYICLFGENGKLSNEIADKACLVHSICDHWDGGVPMITFDRKNILPPMCERLKEAQVFFVKLLHQKDHNFGYSVMQYDEGKFPSRCYVLSNALVSVALENMYRKAELLKLYEERKKSSITDIMTGLLNRRGLMEKLEADWKNLIGRTIAFVSVDLDKLKTINDTYGHAAGDYAIKLIGHAISNVLPDNATGARTGGDEFIVFLRNTNTEQVEKFISNLYEEVDRLNNIEHKTFLATASAGYSITHLYDYTTIDWCLQMSDKALYRAKADRQAKEDEEE